MLSRIENLLVKTILDISNLRTLNRNVSLGNRVTYL